MTKSEMEVPTSPREPVIHYFDYLAEENYNLLPKQKRENNRSPAQLKKRQASRADIRLEPLDPTPKPDSVPYKKFPSTIPEGVPIELLAQDRARLINELLIVQKHFNTQSFSSD
jgi:hypothetical protein